MKEIDKNCKVIIASGFMSTNSITELKEKGLSGFLEKPYRGYELSQLLNELISS
jgi:DNA-binding NtrC family response regulator